MEIVQHNTKNQESVLFHFRIKVQVEHSNTLATEAFVYIVMNTVQRATEMFPS
jgi:hypothetical protein